MELEDAMIESALPKRQRTGVIAANAGFLSLGSVGDVGSRLSTAINSNFAI
jgi:hypothetical protein